MNRYKKGDIAFGLINNREVEQVSIESCGGGLYTIRLPKGGITKVKGHRLFATPKEAEESIQRSRTPSFRMSGTMYT